MELTGKCKNDFLNHINKKELDFYLYSQNTQLRLIVKWFNEINIKMTFYKSKLGGCMVHYSNEFSGAKFTSQEIKESAIFQANNIYNGSL